ncbi:hypothetical protein [Mesorhizobium sp.]|uniref:hypothetical protein n=1 Tax=Mesorhizobium sp. TaxID=1871066 RepID=UPI000FE745AA|nr:hypothetical protein [Mesorhizobium sp.]RWE37425.1 MAG: hypothetical protein EOS77_02275 [Mesorhizobium sp.]
MSEFLSKVEELARAAHARRCRFNGITDPASIDLYWTSCDQRAYRRQAAEQVLAERKKEVRA